MNRAGSTDRAGQRSATRTHQHGPTASLARTVSGAWRTDGTGRDGVVLARRPAWEEGVR